MTSMSPPQKILQPVSMQLFMITYEEMLKDKNVDLVYIATPPFLHYPQSKMALMAKKHVICEKPQHCIPHEAEELAAIAARGSAVRCEPDATLQSIVSNREVDHQRKTVR
jgi:formylmethanofuran dehydrogenase subunit B